MSEKPAISPMSDKAVKKSISLPESLLGVIQDCMSVKGINDFSDFQQRAAKHYLKAEGFEVKEAEVDQLRSHLLRARALGIDVNSLVAQAIIDRENVAASKKEAA